MLSTASLGCKSTAVESLASFAVSSSVLASRCDMSLRWTRNGFLDGILALDFFSYRVVKTRTKHALSWGEGRVVRDKTVVARFFFGFDLYYDLFSQLYYVLKGYGATSSATRNT